MTAKCEAVEENEPHYKLVPPDGGWGYMIALAMVIVMTVVTAPMSCFGIIYGEFFETRHISTGAVGLQNGVAFFTFSVSAFLTNIALKNFSLRSVGLWGAALYIAGTFGSIFMNSFFEFMVFGGFLASSGGGLMMTCIMTAFNLYFEKKRVFVMSVSQTFICLLSIVAPILINYSITEFGFRGTLILLCGVALQNVVAFALVQPVDRHLVEDGAPPAHYILHELEPLSSDKKGITKSILAKQGEADRSNLTPDDVTEGTVNKSRIRMLADYLDLPLLQQPVFLNVCFGTALALAVDMSFVTLLPLHLIQAKWSADEIALLLTLLTVGDAVGRVALAVISGFYNVNSRLAFLLGAIGTTVLKFGMFTFHGVLEMTIACAVMGFFRCFLMVTYPLVIADEVPADKYPAAQGLEMLLCGLFSFVISPAAGAVKDWTGSYVVSFHLLTSLGLFLCIVPWVLELILTKRKRPVVHILQNAIYGDGGGTAAEARGTAEAAGVGAV